MRNLVPLLAVVLTAVPAAAADIDKEFPFKLDEWFPLEVSEGDLTIHRVRVKTIKGNVKSKIFRPTNTEFVQTVQIQVEYTNDSSRDVEADLDIVWVDSRGNVIDGYRDEEDMDEDEHDEMTAMISTSAYGLEQAKKLLVKIHF